MMGTPKVRNSVIALMAGVGASVGWGVVWT